MHFLFVCLLVVFFLLEINHLFMFPQHSAAHAHLNNESASLSDSTPGQAFVLTSFASSFMMVKDVRSMEKKKASAMTWVGVLI